MTAALLYPLYPVVWCIGFVYGFCTPVPTPRVRVYVYGVEVRK